MTLENLPSPDRQVHQPRAFANLQKSYNKTIPRDKVHEMIKTEAFQRLLANGLIQNKNEREIKVCLPRVDSSASPKMQEAKRKSIAVIAEILMEKRKSASSVVSEDPQKTEETKTPLIASRTDDNTPYDDLSDEEVMLIALEIFELLEQEHHLHLLQDSEEIDSDKSSITDSDKKSDEKVRLPKGSIYQSIEDLRKLTEKSRSQAFADLEAIYLKADREEIRKFYLGLLEAREMAAKKRDRVLENEQKNEVISEENLSRKIKDNHKT